MGIAERKERERQQRIDSILDAAEQVFLEKGLRHTTMDEIAETAELSKATLYLYFKAKELLWVGIKLRATKVLADYFTKAIQGRKPGMEKAMAIGEAYVRFAYEQPVYFRSMSSFERMNPEMLRKYSDEPMVQELDSSGLHVLEILADVIREGSADGTLRPDLDPLKTAVYMWASSNGVIQLHMQRVAGFANYGGLEPGFLLEEHAKNLQAALGTGDR